MNEMIKIENQTINNQNIECINARDLHSQLEIKTVFSNWIKRAIDKYGFENNVDYANAKIGNGNNALIEYYVSLEMAKELCMLDDSDKGRNFRKYFIECEKKTKKQELPKINSFLLSQIAETLRMAEQEIYNLSLENNQKEEVIKEYIAIDNNTNCSEVAKSLHLRPNKFIERLLQEKYLYKNGKKNIPMQSYIDNGYFIMKKTTSEFNGEVKHCDSHYITAKGYQHFFRRVKKGEFDNIKI
jgi:anti-repressor protein